MKRNSFCALRPDRSDTLPTSVNGPPNPLHSKRMRATMQLRNPKSGLNRLATARVAFNTSECHSISGLVCEAQESHVTSHQYLPSQATRSMRCSLDWSRVSRPRRKLISLWHAARTNIYSSTLKIRLFQILRGLGTTELLHYSRQTLHQLLFLFTTRSAPQRQKLSRKDASYLSWANASICSICARR